MERQQFSASFETAAAGGAGTGLFSGLAALFNRRVEDAYSTVLLPGTFQRTLTERGTKIKLLLEHQMEAPVGTIELLKENSAGLLLHGRVLMTIQRGREAYELLKARVLDGLSIGFSVRASRQVVAADGVTERHVSDVDLFEISLTSFPASDDARVTTVHRRRDRLDVDRELAALEDQAHQAGLELSPAAPGDDAYTTTRAIVRDLETARTLPDQIRALECAQLSIDLSMALFGSRHRR